MKKVVVVILKPNQRNIFPYLFMYAFCGLLDYIISLADQVGRWFTFVVCWSVSFNLCGPCDASIITLRSWLLLLRWGVSALRWFGY
jgi:hypothetical protein